MVLAGEGVGIVPSLMILAIGLASAALFVSFLGAWRAFVVRPEAQVGHFEPYDDAKLQARLNQLSVIVEEVHSEYEVITGWRDDVSVAVSEGIKHIDRAESRIRSTVSRARKELEKQGFESAGLEAESAELRLVDAGGSEEGELPALREAVEVAGPDFTGIPGDFTPDDYRVAGA